MGSWTCILSGKHTFKWDFVQVLLLNAEGQNISVKKLKKQQDTPNFNSFCHPSQRNEEHIKMWETHPNDYCFLRLRATYHSTFQDGGWVKFPTLGTFRMSKSNSRGLTTPPPPSWGNPMIGAKRFPAYGGQIFFINSFAGIQLTICLIDFSLLSLITTRGAGLFNATIGADSPRLLQTLIADIKACFKSKSSF